MESLDFYGRYQTLVRMNVEKKKARLFAKQANAANQARILVVELCCYFLYCLVSTAARDATRSRIQQLRQRENNMAIPRKLSWFYKATASWVFGLLVV